MQTCFFITMVCNVKLFVHIGCLCSTAATHSCVSCYLFAWRLPLIIIKKIWWHDFPLPSWKSEKSWKGKGRGRKRGIFFFTSVTHFADTDIYSCSETVVWCGYGRLQVISGLLLTKNYACVVLKIGEAPNLLMKRCCSLAWHAWEVRPTPVVQRC